MLDDRAAGAAVAKPLRLQALERLGAPGRVGASCTPVMIPIPITCYAAPRCFRESFSLASCLSAATTARRGMRRPSGTGASRPSSAAFYPLAFAAEQIAVAGTAVKNLTPAGAEPHDLELTPGDVRAVDDAALVLYLGEGFMPGLETAVEQRDGRSLDLLAGEDLKPGRDEGGEVVRDPHVWLDPVRYAAMVRAIGVELGDGARPRASPASSSGSTPSFAAGSRPASDARSSRAMPRSAISRRGTASSRCRSRGSRRRRSRRLAALPPRRPREKLGSDDRVLRDARLSEARADGRARGRRRDGGAEPARGADRRRDRRRGGLLLRHALESRCAPEGARMPE